MSTLTHEQIASYEEFGFLDSIPILGDGEVRYFRTEVESTCAALGGRITRLDGPHLYFRWAWELSTHPRILDCMEQLIGPNIMLKSTRLFYKFADSTSFVAWHQDGLTERVPAVRPGTASPLAGPARRYPRRRQPDDAGRNGASPHQRGARRGDAGR